MLARSLRSAVRRALRRPGTGALAVLTLAVGLGASAALATLSFNVILPSPAWPDAERLVLLHPTGQPIAGTDPDTLRWSTWSVLSGGAIFEDVAASSRVSLAVRDTDQDVEVLPALYVSSSWLRLLGVGPVRGRLFQPSEDARSEDVALISFSLWQRRFGGDEGVVGRSMRLSYRNPDAPIRAYRIVGVLPRHLELDGQSPDVLLPLGLVPAGWQLSPQPIVRVIGKLRAGASPSQTLRLLEPALAGIGSVNVDTGPFVLTRLADREFGEARTDGWLLIAAAGSLLLLALLNYLVIVGLDFSRRSEEYACHLALGATVRDLKSMWLFDGALHGSAAAVIGVIIGQWFAAAARVRMTEAPDALPSLAAIDPGAAVLTGGGALLAVVSGVVLRGVLMLKGQRLGLTTHGRAAPRGRALAAVSLAVTLMLLFASTVLARTVVVRSNQPLGFDVQDLVYVRIGAVLAMADPPSSLALPRRSPGPAGRVGPAGIEAQRREAVFALAAVNDARTAMMFDAVRSVPGVVSVAAVGGAPLFGAPVNAGIVAPGTGPRPQPALRVSVTSDYFETMRIRTLSGRTFRADDHFAGAVVVSSEFARRYLDGSAEGTTFTVISLDESDPGGALRATVIGVVDDVYAGREMSGRAPAFYQLGVQGFHGIPSAMVVRLAGSREGVGVLKRRIEEAAPGALVTMVSTFEDRLALEMAEPRRRSLVAGLFAAFALAISCVAVWATVTRVGLERRREIAIRLAVGASAGSVYGLLGRWYLESAAPGLLLGGAGAFVVAQTFRSHFGSSASLDAGALVAACMVLAAVQALAMVIPVLRAGRVEPIEVLRDG